MNQIKIGVICPSEIAFRRFLPSLQKASEFFKYVAVGIASPEEWFVDISKVPTEAIEEQQRHEMTLAKTFTEKYGGKVIVGYEVLVSSPDIDAIYCPLPPALHYKWAKLALLNNKHVFVEKPSTTSLADTENLIAIASEKKLALHENYMFIYHTQIEEINNAVKNGEIGDVRLYRITFGFPRRAVNDFRYNKNLGGGALLDAGGYCIKYANYLLGGNAHITTAQGNYLDGFEVDMYGSATMANEKGQIAQFAFGMDNDYRCDIEIWGNCGTINSGRILTAPADFTPSYTIKKNQKIENRPLAIDDAFLKSILHFRECIENKNIRTENYVLLQKQEELIEEYKKLCF
ncbi:MAG: Gfo/Idh/MocA family oxidoreductase [Prevotella sp.]